MLPIDEIARTVLSLPVEQRALLAESLLDSLPSPGKEWSESEDLAEVERREHEIESGLVQPSTEAKFWKEVEADRRR